MTGSLREEQTHRKIPREDTDTEGRDRSPRAAQGLQELERAGRTLPGGEGAASSAARRYTSVVLSHLVRGTVMQQPQDTNPGSK